MEQEIILCPRLNTIAQSILSGQDAADVGMDHALLSFYLLQNKLVPRIIGIELGDGPYKRAQNAIAGSLWKNQIDLRQGNGLMPLRPGEVGNVIIAGLGGDNIAEILSRDWIKAESFGYYVLQPMSRARVIRETLARRGWPILQECLVKEKQRFFTIIVTKPGSNPYVLEPLEADLGPVILKNPGPEALPYLESWQRKYIKIRHGYEQAGRDPESLELRDINNKISILEAILCKLQ